MPKFLIVIAIFIAHFSVQANYQYPQKSLCETDDREISQDLAVARMLENEEATNPCTATLIGKNCLITAGHCRSKKNQWITEFNTPLSNPENGIINHSKKEDVYKLDKIYGHLSRYIGKDWMVYSVKKNQITRKYPGELYNSYKILYTPPTISTELSITGYGSDSDNERNCSQQKSYGPLISIESNTMKLTYRVDTTGGNSGSAIISVLDNAIIGIHTHGGCIDIYGANQGTLIAGNKELMQAIKECLNSDF